MATIVPPNPAARARIRIRRSYIIGFKGFSEAVFLQAPVESAAAQAQCFARVADVAAIACQGFLNQDALDFFDAHFIKAQGCLARGAQPQIAGADLRALREQNGALDGVVELADIAGPGMV